MKSTLITGLAVVNELGDVVGDSVLVEEGLIAGIGPRSRFAGSYGVEYRFEGYILPSIVDAHLHIRGCYKFDNKCKYPCLPESPLDL
jgi:imidazolonepropionase-like amidohydrolase